MSSEHPALVSRVWCAPHQDNRSSHNGYYPMASFEASSLEDSGGDFFKDGFVFVKDGDAGNAVEKMEANSIPFASKRGFEFFKVNVLDDPVRTTMSPASKLIQF